jgi:hypothetical protein
MVGFKDNLAKHIDIVNTDSKYVMWFKCSEQLFKTHTIRNKLSLLFTLLYTELFERDVTPS